MPIPLVDGWSSTDGSIAFKYSWIVLNLLAISPIYCYHPLHYMVVEQLFSGQSEVELPTCQSLTQDLSVVEENAIY